MPAIHSFDNGALKIYLYADDHAPPHVHILRNDVECLIRIADLRVMQGEIDRRDYGRVCAWIAGNLGAVEAKWRELNERG